VRRPSPCRASGHAYARPARGIFRTPTGWATVGLIVAVVAITTGEVLAMLRLASWNADFFNTLEQKSVSGLVTQSWILLAIVGGLMLLQAASMDMKMRLQITLRTYLTERVSYAWMADGRHYRLREVAGEHDNADGRIAEDARVVCEMGVEFLVSLLYSVLQLVLFLGVLWLYSGPLMFVLGNATFVVPGHMVWVALLYAGLGAAITLWVGYPLVHATDRRQAAEADYRARLVNALAHSPAIALSGSEPGERRRLGIDFQRIRLAWAAQKTSFRNLIFLSSGYGQLTAVLPMLILAPRYFSGEMSLGTLMQVTIAFGQVAAALSWLSSNYASIAQWEASPSVCSLLPTLSRTSAKVFATKQEGASCACARMDRTSHSTVSASSTRMDRSSLNSSLPRSYRANAFSWKQHRKPRTGFSVRLEISRTGAPDG
jgi:vitamin B12/bleomycin/antimicrobial peptide transport system ATP-binding/permease protein